MEKGFSFNNVIYCTTVYKVKRQADRCVIVGCITIARRLSFADFYEGFFIFELINFLVSSMLDNALFGRMYAVTALL